MNKPILSIIIVNWNTADITVDCIKSIFTDKGLKETPYEIIMVDNASTDDSVAKVKKLKGPIKIIVNKENIGFGRANNQGLEISQGNYILLLNTDTLILHSAISQSLDWLSSHPESYGCTAQLLNKDKTIQPSGGYFPNIRNISSLLLHLDDLPFVNSLTPPYHPHSPDFYTHDKYYLKDHPQDWVTGAFMLVRREMITKVRGFNPDFFMYGEEMEMCYRIHQQFPTLQLWYLVSPQIIHLGGASSTSKQIIYDREYEGIIMFFRMHRSRLEQWLLKYLISINRFLQLHLYKYLRRV
ncbi:glycosyltransferase family 2 protein [Candidatus Shapirobacteria bacterium]|nr:glycosyltransferase family 2 protein [Candidatus Shapirobacteria bacterium]